MAVKKAYTSLGFKSNTLETSLTLNEWARVKTSIPYTLGSADSGNCQVVANGDDTYNCKYIDALGFSRTFLMNTSMFIDFSAGNTMKKIEMRFVLKRDGVAFPMDTFCQVESDNDGEAVSSTVVLNLIPDDEVYFECRNITNSDDITFKFSAITVVEV